MNLFSTTIGIPKHRKLENKTKSKWKALKVESHSIIHETGESNVSLFSDLNISDTDNDNNSKTSLIKSSQISNKNIIENPKNWWECFSCFGNTKENYDNINNDSETE